MIEAARRLWGKVVKAVPREKTNVGAVAVLLGFADQHAVDEATVRQNTVDRGKPFGEILVEQGALTRDQLREVISTQKMMRRGKSADVMAVALQRRLRTVGPMAAGIVAAHIGKAS